MRIQNAKVFDVDAGFCEKEVAVQGELFAEHDSGNEILDAKGCYMIPGLVDIHTHGCVKQDFSTADLDGIHEMASYQARQGITALCPTTMTLPEPVLETACRNIAAYRQPGTAQIVGIYLEGPFVSHSKLGAQNPAYVQTADIALFRRLQSASGGIIKLLAIAPETDGAMDVIEQLGGEVICSIAHTAADYSTAMEAFRRGAKQLTHLYNAMPPFSHREPGVIGAAFDTENTMVELICDGVHVHPSVVRATFRMFGDDRIMFISDSMMATGLDDGLYELGGLPVKVEGNTARLRDSGAIAGSVTNLMDCVRTAVREMGIPLHSAVKCASTNPAKEIGEFERRGSITPGKLADFVLLDENLQIQDVFINGSRVAHD